MIWYDMIWYDAVNHQSIALPDSAEMESSALLQTKPPGLEVRHLKSKKDIIRAHLWKAWLNDVSQRSWTKEEIASKDVILYFLFTAVLFLIQFLVL